jgi:hypothetical protein
MHIALSPAAAPLRPSSPAIGLATPPRRFGAALEGQRPPESARAPAVRSTAQVALEALERARTDLDAAVAAARTGRTFSPSELLALQSQAYRYGQTVEVASKIVEQATQAVKQAVNTQV